MHPPDHQDPVPPPRTPPAASGNPTLLGGAQVGQGRFVLKEELGRGGMGVVWLARDTMLKEEVALKFLPPEIRHDASALSELQHETQKSRRLSHPNIIRIHDLCQFPGEVPFISLEYVAGTTLSALKAAQPQRLLSWTDVQPFARQLCATLEYAHGEGVAHRDLKPSNLMVDTRGRLKLADFGLSATITDSLSRISFKVANSGTPAYMSPQQMNGRPPKATDDIYSLGATLYELLTSKPPFYTGDLRYQVQNVLPDSLEQRLSDLELENPIPAGVSASILACLLKDPTQRPQSVTDVAAGLGFGGNAPAPNALMVVSAQAVVAAAEGLETAALATQGDQAPMAMVEEMPTAALEIVDPKPRWSGKRLLVVLVVVTTVIGAGLNLIPWKKIEKNSGSTPVANTPVSDGYALSFSKGDRVTMSTLLISLQEPLTIEGYVTPSEQSGQQVSLLAFDRINIRNEGGRWRAWVWRAGIEDNLESAVDSVPGRRTHVALVVDGEQVRLYVDGKRAGLPPQSDSPLRSARAKFEIGFQFSGSVDEVRVSKTVRYQKDFTPQARFTSDDNTLGLYHCDEGVGSVLKDSSGNGHHGQINGANWVKAATANSSPTTDKPVTKITTSVSTPAPPGLFQRLAQSFRTAPKTGPPALPSAARRTNSLGQVFVPVPGTEVQFCIWATRVKDYEAFVSTTGRIWEKPTFTQGPMHPAVMVSWDDAQAFCKWLTEQELKTGKIPMNSKYRLPTDAEWSWAVGIGDKEAAGTPAEKSGKLPSVYPWGGQWPPPKGAGNYAPSLGVDTFANTSPVGSFAPNALGLYDLGGNVWQWCEDWHDGQQINRVLRGGSWFVSRTELLLSSCRGFDTPDRCKGPIGFRIVLAGMVEPTKP